MMGKSNRVLASAFFAMLLFGMAGSFAGAGQEVIKTERRKAAAFPEISFEGILNREVMDGMEDYVRDHAVFREELRGFKADALTVLLRKKENNGLYRVGDAIYRLEYPLNEEKITRAARKFSGIAAEYFPDADIYYSIIPDKNYFAAEENGYPFMDYGRLFSLMHENMTDASYIGIADLLSAEDYYRTDLHWKQEKIVDAADFLLDSMERNGGGSRMEYSVYAEYDAYCGSYAAQSGWKGKPDTIVCLTNPAIESALVTDYEKNMQIPVYSTQFFAEGTESMDEYDVYLSGAKALLRMENTQKEGGGELVLFRDSFGSSIAPLLLCGYSAVTMIDLRYVTMEYVNRMMELPEQCDVLFLYNTQILNHSDSMR